MWIAYRIVMRIALYEPEIAGNVGAILRLAACMDVAVDIIDPCGFPFSDKKLKRSGMDYAERVDLARHADWPTFQRTKPGRLILMSSKAETLLGCKQQCSGQDPGGCEKGCSNNSGSW